MNKDLFKRIVADFWLGGWWSNLVYSLSSNETKTLIDEDMDRYRKELPEIINSNKLLRLRWVLLYYLPARNVFVFRIRQNRFIEICCRLILRPLKSVEIGKSATIDGGFRIYHNYSVILPCRAGKNFTVDQGVTIGRSRRHNAKEETYEPIIGNNVWIGTNSVVAGGINIGNNVTIGAGSIVLQDVSDNLTVVGNPPYVIYDGKEKIGKVPLKDYNNERFL